MLMQVNSFSIRFIINSVPKLNHYRLKSKSHSLRRRLYDNTFLLHGCNVPVEKAIDEGVDYATSSLGNLIQSCVALMGMTTVWPITAIALITA